MKNLNNSEFLSHIINNIDVGLILIDPQNHSIIKGNKTFYNMLGLSEDKVIGKVCHGFICPNELGKCPITDLKKDISKKECIMNGPSNLRFPIYKTVKKIEIDNKEYLLESLIDIRELKAIQRDNEKLKEHASTDFLTGVFNRRSFESQFLKEVNVSKNNESPLAFFILDIDNFKQINDKYGHSIGDKALIKVSNMLSSICRSQDTIGRLGGDEFGILVPHISITNAKKLGIRINKTISKMKVEINETSFFVTLSIGISIFKPGETIKELVHRADTALYKSKQKGKNKTTVLE